MDFSAGKNANQEVQEKILHLIEESLEIKQSDGKTLPSPRSQDFSSMPKEKIEKRILRQVGQAIGDFQLIGDGDRIMVGISGGKDSWVTLHVLEHFKKVAPISFELVAVNIDQGYGNFRQDQIENFLAAKDMEYHMEEFDIASIVEEKTAKGKLPCSLCSRLRRGHLYGLAEKYKCHKIALGHHMDDLIETFLMNAFFIGKTAAMPAKLISDDQKNTVIRPLVYVSEGETQRFSDLMNFPIVRCDCPLACGRNVHSDQKRRFIKNLINQLEYTIPNIRSSLLTSLTNIRPSQMLDRNLWSFDSQ